MLSTEILVKEIFLTDKASFQVVMDDNDYILRICPYTNNGDIHKSKCNYQVIFRKDKRYTDLNKMIDDVVSTANGFIKNNKKNLLSK